MVRFKNRWILVEFLDPASFAHSPNASGPPTASTPSQLDEKKIWNALKSSILLNFGDIGWGPVGQSLTVKYYSPQTRMCIIRVGRDHHNIAWAAITLLTSIDGISILPQVIHVSGTIKHAKLAAIEHNRKVVGRFRERAQTAAAYRDSYEAYLEQSTAQIEALQD